MNSMPTLPKKEVGRNEGKSEVKLPEIGGRKPYFQEDILRSSQVNFLSIVAERNAARKGKNGGLILFESEKC